MSYLIFYNETSVLYYMESITDRLKILSLLNTIGKYKFQLMKIFSINIMIDIDKSY